MFKTVAQTFLHMQSMKKISKEINDFPLYNFTDDSKVEIGLSCKDSHFHYNKRAYSTFIMDFLVPSQYTNAFVAIRFCNLTE